MKDDAPPPGKEVRKTLRREMEGVVASRGAMLSRTISVDRGVDGHRKVDVVGAEAVV